MRNSIEIRPTFSGRNNIDFFKNSTPTLTVEKTIEGYLDDCFARYFEPLISKLHLRELTRKIDGMAGLYEAHGQNVLVRLINERGIANFEVYCIPNKKLWCDVGLLSELLEPPSKLKSGVRRPDLKQEAEILQKHWQQIEHLFSNEHAEITKTTLHQHGLTRSRKMFGRVVK